MTKRAWIRGALTLAIIGGLAAALIASPVGAANPITKAKAKNIARKQSTNVFNSLIGPATDPLLGNSENLVVANQGGQGDDMSDPQQVNSLSIAAPFAGFLIISGSVEVDEDDGILTEYCLTPKLDGAKVPTTPSDQGGCGDVDGGTFDFANLAYTVVTPVAAGPHTVTQEINFGGPNDDWFHAHLVAHFVASGSVTNVARQTSRESR